MDSNDVLYNEEEFVNKREADDAQSSPALPPPRLTKLQDDLFNLI